MSMRYKFDVLKALKEKGYSTYRLRKETIFSQSVIKDMKDNNPKGFGTLEKLCKILNCQPGDILIYEKDEEETE